MGPNQHNHASYDPDMPGVAPTDYAQEVADRLGNEVVPDIPQGWRHAVILYCETVPRDKDNDPQIGLHVAVATAKSDDPEGDKRVFITATRLILEAFDPGGLEGELAASRAALAAYDRVELHKRTCATCTNNLSRPGHARRPCITMAGLIAESERVREIAGQEWRNALLLKQQENQGGQSNGSDSNEQPTTPGDGSGPGTGVLVPAPLRETSGSAAEGNGAHSG